MVGQPLPAPGEIRSETLGARHPHLNGVVVFDQRLHLIQLILNLADHLAKELSYSLAALLTGEQSCHSFGQNLGL